MINNFNVIKHIFLSLIIFMVVGSISFSFSSDILGLIFFISVSIFYFVIIFLSELYIKKNEKNIK